MRHMSYRAAALAAAILTSTVAVDANATCWNKGCDYKDSGVQGCRDGTQFTAASATIKTSSGSVLGHVSLVYSGTCGAAWSYATSAVGSVHSVLAQVRRDDGTTPFAECSDCTGKRSPMVGDVTNRSSALGELRLEIIGHFFPFQATTAWF